tara:strand:- start:48 stop:698 length:651 start_codon:yes stop_codon:yes gene_type:complete
MGTLFVDKLDPQSGTSLELGSSGDTVSVNASATTNLAGNVTLGANGKTVTVPSGCTITNSGTATGFGMSSANTPMFAIGMSADQGPNNNTFTLMEFSNEEVDTDNAYTNTAGNYKFTVPSGKAGKYFIYAFTLCNAINADDFISGAIALYKNGSNTVESTLNVRNDRIRYNTSYVGHVFDLSEGDYIQAYAFVDSDDGAVKFNSGANSRFGGFKLT